MENHKVKQRKRYAVKYQIQLTVSAFYCVWPYHSRAPRISGASSGEPVQSAIARLVSQRKAVVESVTKSGIFRAGRE